MRRESGDQRGRWLFSPSWVICLGVPPASGTVQICCGFLLAATSTLCTVNATHCPSGEIWGSPMRFSASSALTSKGCFWAYAKVSDAKRIISRRHIHDDCSARCLTSRRRSGNGSRLGEDRALHRWSCRSVGSLEIGVATVPRHRKPTRGDPERL